MRKGTSCHSGPGPVVGGVAWGVAWLHPLNVSSGCGFFMGLAPNQHAFRLGWAWFLGCYIWGRRGTGAKFCVLRLCLLMFEVGRWVYTCVAGRAFLCSSRQACPATGVLHGQLRVSRAGDEQRSI